MDRDQALAELPDTDGAALRLRDGGVPDRVIAIALGIDIADVPGVLARAQDRLARLAGGRNPRDPSLEGSGHG